MKSVGEVRYDWSHPSVFALAGTADPISVIVEKARALTLGAMESGWEGPPFDPFALAEHLRIPVAARSDILDARTVPAPGGKLRIEYNPNKPRARMRYSVCHEIAHTIFPDCRKRIRNRATHEVLTEDEWQLEMLCNIGAAEFLMPVGSFEDLGSGTLSIDHLLTLRKQFDVSTEALLLRVVKLTHKPCFVFCASSRDGSSREPRYRLDYVVVSRTWGHAPDIRVLPKGSLVEGCTGIGFTAKGRESWSSRFHDLKIECVGIPPYPGHILPRVVGIGHTKKAAAVEVQSLSELVGDATEPRGSGNILIAHIVNDKASTWGAGFGLAVRKKWPLVQQGFRRWVDSDRHRFVLGNIYVSHVSESLGIVHMICQKGYGPSAKPRIRYGALKECLLKLGKKAASIDASIHMPRIGSGQAGGSWGVISELIDDALCRNGHTVFVYDLPGRMNKREQQPAFGFPREQSTQ